MAVYLDNQWGQWQLPQGISVLGRGPDCDLRMDDLRLSRRHARFVVEGSGLLIEDLGSTNGILVDDERIEGPVNIPSGSLVTIGPLCFRVRIVVGERDPSRIHSETVAASPAPASSPAPLTRKASEEFQPSTDRAGRKTMDMQVSTPVALPDTEIPVSRSASALSAALTERREWERKERESSEVLGREEDELRPAEPGQLQTEALVPSDQGRRKSDALLPRDDGGRPIQDVDRQFRLRPLAVEEASPRDRILAGLGDGLLVLGTAIALSHAGLALGWWLAQWWAADVPAEGMARGFWQQIQWWHLQGDRAWFLLAGGVISGVLAAFWVVLWLAVGRSALYGAPPLHQRGGLVLIEDRSGHYPGPGRLLLRLILLSILFLPALISALQSRRGIHDRLLGCRVQRRS